MRICRTGNAWLSLYDYDGCLLIRTRDWKAVRQMCSEYLERTGRKDNAGFDFINKKSASLITAAQPNLESKSKIKCKPIRAPELDPAPNPKK